MEPHASHYSVTFIFSVALTLATGRHFRILSNSFHELE